MALEPEKRNAMNFVIAMPVFAEKAAMMALVPPDALMNPKLHSPRDR